MGKKRAVGFVLVIFVILLIGAPVIAREPKVAPAPAPSSSPKLPGRYMIIPVEYNATGYNGEYKACAILKLDTITGETWVLEQVATKTDNGNAYYWRHWEELFERVEHRVDKEGKIIPGTFKRFDESGKVVDGDTEKE